MPKGRILEIEREKASYRLIVKEHCVNGGGELCKIVIIIIMIMMMIINIMMIIIKLIMMMIIKSKRIVSMAGVSSEKS